jgi:DNA invertase Pin-like site-specific DNA recombinase
MPARVTRWRWSASIGRALAELLTTVETLRGQGIALLSLKKIDTSSAAGELIFHVFGAIAHFERRLISERTRDGIAAARAMGKQPGRQPLDMSKVDAAIKLVEASYLAYRSSAATRHRPIDHLSRNA